MRFLHIVGGEPLPQRPKGARVVPGGQRCAIHRPDRGACNDVGEPFVLFQKAHNAHVVSATAAAAGKDKRIFAVF